MVEASGVKMNEVTDKAVFRAAMGLVYDKFIATNPDLKPLLDEIKATN